MLAFSGFYVKYINYKCQASYIKFLLHVSTLAHLVWNNFLMTVICHLKIVKIPKELKTKISNKIDYKHLKNFHLFIFHQHPL